MTPSPEIALEPNKVNETPSEMNETNNTINETDEVDHAVPILPDASPPAQPVHLITMSVASGDDSTKSNIHSVLDEATGRTCKATVDTNAIPISDADLEVGGTNED